MIGKFIFASLIATFRHGREEDEVMGISFKKELVIDRVQVHPAAGKEGEKSKLQVISNQLICMWQDVYFQVRFHKVTVMPHFSPLTSNNSILSPFR